MLTPQQAKVQLLHWHRWSVELRAATAPHSDPSVIPNMLYRALDGSTKVPRYGPTTTPWLNGEDYDHHAAQALIEGFVELYKTLMRGPLPDRVRLHELFDAVEVLPLELMRVGPHPVEHVVASYAERMNELVPMALVFRHRLRMKPFERDAVRLLVAQHIADDVLDRVCDAHNARCDHSPLGYLLTLRDPALPTARMVLAEPVVLGRTEHIEVGFIVFLEDQELTLECHGWGTTIPQDLRERRVLVSIEPRFHRSE